MENYFPEEEWEQKLPEELGLSEQTFLSLDKDRKARYQRINSMVILKDGYIVYEKYANGYKVDTLCELMSATKSVVSALIGIAIENQLITGTQDRLVDYFPEYLSAESDFFLDEVTIEQLLTMTSGDLLGRWNKGK